MFENLKLRRPLAVLDLESTGTDPCRDRVVEVAVLRCCPGGKRRILCLRVNPSVPIPPAATVVHGITDAEVRDSPTFERIANRLVSFLDGCDLAGFGLARFDVPLLIAEFARVGMTFALTDRRVIDAMQIYHAMQPRDLNAAHERYVGSALIGAHRAGADVRATARVLDAMLAIHTELPRTVGGLYRTFAGPDLAGRFRVEGDEVVFAFGKHRGKPVADVAVEDAGYLRWMIEADFLDDAREIARAALRRVGSPR